MIRSPLSARQLLPVLMIPLAAVLAPGAPAQTSRHDGQPIRSVEYVGLHALPPETLSFYLFGDGPAPGRRLDADDLDRRLKTLWERELVDDVRIEAEPVEGGVRLIIRVVERPILVSVDYEGTSRVSRAEINEQIDRERIALHEGQPLDLAALGRVVRAVEELYKEKGFRFAEVAYELEDVAPGKRRVRFTVDEGSKVRIGDIRFDGNTVYGDWRLRRAMKKTKESGLVSRFTKKAIYDPAHLEEDLESVRDLYRRSGYKDVLIDRPEIGVEARRPEAPTIEEQKRRLLVTIPIEEGERWRLGEVRLEGNEVLAEEVLLRQFDAPRGGWLRSRVVDDALEKIDRLYKSIGYIFADVRAEVEEVSGTTADVVVRIEERDQFRIGRVEFAGNTKTQDKVLRRELFLQEGSVLNMTAVQNSLLRIRQLNYFALEEEEPVRFDFDADARTVDLEVQGQEADRTEVQFGGGWSEPDGFFGQFGVRTTNFRGRGETVGISVQAGQERELFDLSYGVPWFLDRPQNVSARVFRQTQKTRVGDVFFFDREQSGAAFTYGRNLRGFQGVNLTYSFSDIDDVIVREVEPEDDTDDGEVDGFVTEEGSLKVSSLRPSWVFNTLDSRFEPTRGLRLAASLELAGGVLGGDSSYVRPQAELTWFRPLAKKPFRSSFGFHVEAGAIEPYDGTELFATQRYFLGGESSVRGFRTGSISVREAGTVQLFDDDGNPLLDDDGNPVFEERPLRLSDSGFALGGDSQLSFSLEYHVLLDGPFRLVFFGDGGGVFARDQGFDTSLLRYSAGAELRVTVPLFPAPLRLIWANNLEPLEGDRFNTIDFSLSASF